MKPALAGAVIALLALIGWWIRYDVAAETQVRAIVHAPELSRRGLPQQEVDRHLLSIARDTSSPARRCAAMELLKASKSDEVTRAFLLALGDPDPKVQSTAAACVGAHSARIDPVLNSLAAEEILGLLRSSPVTNTLTYVFGLVLRARPEMIVEASQVVLPRLGPTQVGTTASMVEHAVRGGSPQSNRPLTDAERSRVIESLRGGLDSPHTTVQALFAVEIAERGGPEPSDEQVHALLDGFMSNGEFHGFFFAAEKRHAPRIEEWARIVLKGDRSTGVFWTLLALERGLAVKLAREGLANPEPSVQMECERWLDSYDPEER